MGFTQRRSAEDSEKAEYERMREIIMPEIRQLFRPEFLNRIDDIILFHALTRVQVRAVLDILLTQTQARLSEQYITLEITEAARDIMAERGYDAEFGARPLRRTVQEMLQDPLAEMLLRGDLASGDKALVDAGTDGALRVQVMAIVGSESGD